MQKDRQRFVTSEDQANLTLCIFSDGSASGLNVPALIGSGYSDAGLWWHAGDDAVHDPQGPLEFIPQVQDRGLGHVHLEWDPALHSQVGNGICGNGDGSPCNAVGYIRHKGSMFSLDNGLPVTANADIAGPVGGYGWYLELAAGAPKELKASLIEVDPTTPLMFSVAYPVGTTINVAYEAAWCSPSAEYSCTETFTAVASVDAVRNSEANVYHFSSNGVLTVRIVMAAQTFAGDPDWSLLDWNSIGKWGNGYALDRFERAGVWLPRMTYGPELVITSNCGSTDGVYCDGSIDTTAVEAEIDNVCPPSYPSQRSYDHCCDATQCVFVNGNTMSL